MRIKRVIIKNYRNIKSVDLMLESTAIVVGENNSGKTNFLKAISLPLKADEEKFSKRLAWHDINEDAKKQYYDYIELNWKDISAGRIDVKEFALHIPSVEVYIELEPGAKEHYDVKSLHSKIRDNKIIYAIQYRFFIEKPEELLQMVCSLISKWAEEPVKIDSIKRSLLPIDAFSYTITVPNSGATISRETLSRFRYVTLQAERDDFLSDARRLGSKPLVDILRKMISPSGYMRIEQKYTEFFHTIKTEGRLDEILNWQNYAQIPNAESFFEKISILPNIPNITGILGGVRLGYDDESLSLQGLGQRNLILIMVILNSYLNEAHDLAFRLVTVEEPEAHLSTNNIHLVASFFNCFNNQSKYTQFIYSTHSSEFINKMGLEKVIVFHAGNAWSLKECLSEDERDYLAKNPNTDVLRLFFSHRTILVEGLTEELLIKSYLQTRNDLNDIVVISFHKGYQSIIKIWKKINAGTDNRLGIVRDYDNQENAKIEHESLQCKEVKVYTTREYTLETEIVQAGNNYQLLREKYGEIYGWKAMTADELQLDWRAKKSDVMFRICQDLIRCNLDGFVLPQHIQNVIDFMMSGE